MTFSSDKKQLRALCLEARLALDSAQAKAASQAVCALLQPLLVPGKLVAGYIAMRGELDILPALTGQTCLPVVTNGELQFRRWRAGEPLIAGAYGTQTPSDSAPLVTPDIILTPLLAFDAKGHRLGYGGGYYDRAIRRLRAEKKPVQIIGVAYSIQQVEHIPFEPQDEILDLVVTEKGLVKPA